MSTVWGTSYFVSHQDAIEYYMAYEYGTPMERRKLATDAVRTKLDSGSIHLGVPHLKNGEKLVRLNGGRRYGIVEDC